MRMIIISIKFNYYICSHLNRLNITLRKELTMSNKAENEWQPLAKHGQWLIEYRSSSRIIRVHLDDTILYLKSEAYQLLWGTITEGLDVLERVEDDQARLMNQKHALQSQVGWPQTRH